MVDINDVYLDIKLNYKNVIKEIHSKDLLTIDEIKTKIKELFCLNRCNFEDLDLIFAKNNKKIINEDDLIFLSDEISEYQYAIEINVENKSDIKIEEIKELKNKIKELVKKKNSLTFQVEKMKIDIEKNKKAIKTKKEINTQKYIKFKNELSNNIYKKIKDYIIENKNKMIKDINEQNEKIIKPSLENNINDKQKSIMNFMNPKFRKLSQMNEGLNREVNF